MSSIVRVLARVRLVLAGIGLISAVIESHEENPFEVVIPAVADSGGWSRIDVEMLSGTTRGVAVLRWTNVELLLRSVSPDGPTYITARKSSFFSAAVNRYSVGKPCAI